MSNHNDDEDDVSVTSDSTSDSGSSISDRGNFRFRAEPERIDILDRRTLAQNNVAESIAPSRGTSSSIKTEDVSFLTPVPSAKKKVVRRTNLQIQADQALKTAAKVTKVPKSSKSESKSESDVKYAAATTVTINGEVFPVQAAKSVWTTGETMELIRAFKNWDDQAKASQSKKLCSLSKLWLVHIPFLMGKSFGRVRACPKEQLASSPYQSKWLVLRKKVSDYNAAQVDGREEELPDIEGPTGGGFDENGVEDERMSIAAASEAARDHKRNNRYINVDVDEESLKIIKLFNNTFPESVSGIGLMSESEATTGGEKKREYCQVNGLDSSALAEDFLGSPPAKKVSKASLIIDLTKTSIKQHEEMMTFNKSNLEYQKEIRMQDIARRESHSKREIEYRDRQDSVNQERYLTEQARLVEARQDAKEMQTTFSGILTNLLGKL